MDGGDGMRMGMGGDDLYGSGPEGGSGTGSGYGQPWLSKLGSGSGLGTGTGEDIENVRDGNSGSGSGGGIAKLAEISHLFNPSSSSNRHSNWKPNSNSILNSNSKTNEKCIPPPPAYRELTFSETVKPVGLKIHGVDEIWGGGGVGVGVGAGAGNGNGKTNLPGGIMNGEIEGGDDEDDEFTSVETRLFAHSPGWTLFERLYLFNGSFYVVTWVHNTVFASPVPFLAFSYSLANWGHIRWLLKCLLEDWAQEETVQCG